MEWIFYAAVATVAFLIGVAVGRRRKSYDQSCYMNGAGNIVIQSGRDTSLSDEGDGARCEYCGSHR